MIKTLLFLLPFFLFIFSFKSVKAQSGASLQQQAMLLQATLEKHHYRPRPCDDALSRQVFANLIEQLDPSGLYFTAADLQALDRYRNQIDDELKGGSWQFLPGITALYQRRLLEARKTFEEILQKPLVYTAGENITFSKRDSTDVAPDEKQLRQRWSKWLKYQALKQLSAGGAETTPEATLRRQVKAMEERKLKRVLEHPAGYETYLGTLFCQALASCYDPHTNYFSQADLQHFEAGLSKENLSFGLSLEEGKAGEIVIQSLVPGGPAWRSNALHKGDVLLSVQWTGKKAVDLTGADLEEVAEVLSEPNTGSMALTVRKASGLTTTVTLKKEKLRADENIVKSYILQGTPSKTPSGTQAKTRKIGYISLPGFYSETENAAGQGCADDVAREIVKLKQEKIEGLVLDIRFNGGGSLLEGLSLAGIFIDEGPLCLLHERDGKPVVMKDLNRGTIYDGPLLVLVNSQSASASEVLASTLQDYNRALIVGSTTFGKASGQIVMPLKPGHPVRSGRQGLQSAPGFAKVTVSRLYRVTGKSAQRLGVQPDVCLPDIFESIDFREETLPFALPSDSLSRKVYFSPLKALPVAELSRKSQTRLTADSPLLAVRQLSDARRKREDRPEEVIPLQPAGFARYMTEQRQWFDALEKALERPVTSFSVRNTSYDQELLRIDSYGQEINTLLIGKMQQDIYLEEAYRIMQDLIAAGS